MTVKYQVMKVATVMKAGVGWNKLVTVGRSWTKPIHWNMKLKGMVQSMPLRRA